MDQTPAMVNTSVRKVRREATNGGAHVASEPRLMRLALLTVTLGAGLMLNCQSEDPVEAFIEASDTLRQKQCPCFAQLEYASEAECEVAFGFTPSQARCVQSVYDRNTATMNPYLECLVRETRALTRCLDPIACGDTSAFSNCQSRFDLDSDRCPALPRAVEAEYADCR